MLKKKKNLSMTVKKKARILSLLSPFHIFCTNFTNGCLYSPWHGCKMPQGWQCLWTGSGGWEKQGWVTACGQGQNVCRCRVCVQDEGSFGWRPQACLQRCLLEKMLMVGKSGWIHVESVSYISLENTWLFILLKISLFSTMQLLFLEHSVCLIRC